MRSRVIAVAGAKGSPGASFVAAGLACRLASLEVPVLAIDADAEDRTLRALLDVGEDGVSPARGDLAELGVLTPEALRALTLEIARNLRLFEPPLPDAGGLDGRAIAGAARESGFGAVVCDLGHQHGALQKQLGAAADWVIWVVEPDRVGLDRADRTLAATAIRAGSAALVLNRLGPHTLRGADRALCERHEMPLAACIVEDRRAAARCTAARPWHTHRRFRGAFDDLARTLHPDLARPRRGSWP
jgi:Flp pilus assembly CpaE family ATPase